MAPPAENCGHSMSGLAGIVQSSVLFAKYELRSFVAEHLIWRHTLHFHANTDIRNWYGAPGITRFLVRNDSAAVGECDARLSNSRPLERKGSLPPVGIAFEN